MKLLKEFFQIWSIYLSTGLKDKHIRDRIQIPVEILIELIKFYSPDIIKKPTVFWWFQRELKLTNSLEF